MTKKEKILELIKEEPRTKEDLRKTLDISRSYLHRVLGGLIKEKKVIEKDGFFKLRRVKNEREIQDLFHSNTGFYDKNLERNMIKEVHHNIAAMEHVVEVVSPDDFFHPTHREIYRKITETYFAFGDEWKSEEIGLDGNEKKLVEQLIDEGEDDFFAYKKAASNIVKKRKRRELAKKAKETINEFLSKPSIEKLSKNILEVTETIRGVEYSETAPIQDVLLDSIDMIEKRRNGEIEYLDTGYTLLDNKLGGLKPSQLIFIAARPAVGKTSFATNIALEAAKLGQPVAFISLEMNARELGNKFLALGSGIDSQKLDMGVISIDQLDLLNETAARLSNLPLHLDTNPYLSIPSLRTKGRRLRKARKIEMIIIDYIGLMTVPGRNNQYEKMVYLTRELKLIAKELDIPIIVLSQLNREMVRGEKIRRPRLSDLRGSGTKEQDADVVVFLHREDIDKQDIVEDRVDVIVAKNRVGRTGTIPFDFILPSGKFVERDY